ncbi:hypothetical protein AGMMS49531_09820 [Endomicrobiia bacterium]|nr:hypothetical protein AGMMS49531_09820 [Endomicrobiia bacterium]
MTLKTLSTLFMTYTLFSMFLSSCDKNDALIVNRRIASPEKIAKYEKMEEGKEKEDQKKGKDEEISNQKKRRQIRSNSN